MFVCPCVILYSHDPREMLASLIEATEDEMRQIAAGPHNARRLSELAHELVEYRRLLAAAERAGSPRREP